LSDPLTAAIDLQPFVPSLVVDWLRDAPETGFREIDGTLTFVDISGFTKMTEGLPRHGKVGAEEMNDLLDACFSRLLEVAYGDGAGLIKWGGDAVLLLFDGPDHEAGRRERRTRSYAGAVSLPARVSRRARIRAAETTSALASKRTSEASSA
jgi:class 3 adenylate cyclase